MSADLLSTLDLMARLKTVLSAIDHPTINGQKLFEVVEYSEDKNLAEALQDLIILKQRVCLIVPAGDDWQRRKEGRTMHADRTTSLDLLFADRAYTKGGQDAAFGGANNVGVVKMHELVLATLAENPQLEAGNPAYPLRWCALVPVSGAFLSIAADEAKALPGRQAYAVNYETPSGEITLPMTAAWPA